MPVDELLSQIASRGLLLHNLFQLSSDKWQANLSSGIGTWEYGVGETAEEALSCALVEASKGLPEPFKPFEGYKIASETPKAKPSPKPSATYEDLFS